MSNTYQRETDEFQAVEVTFAGSLVTTGVEFSVVKDGQRPATYTPAVVQGGEIGVRVAGYDPGNWRVFARVTNAPDAQLPVLDCGTFRVV